MSSANDTPSGLIAKPEKFSYIECKKCDAQEVSASNMSASSLTLGFASIVASVVAASPAGTYLTNGESVILVDCDAAVDAVTLSSADAAVPGRTICVKWAGNAQTIQVETEGSEQIDEAVNAVINGSLRQARTFMSDGSNWWVISENSD